MGREKGGGRSGERGVRRDEGRGRSGEECECEE